MAFCRVRVNAYWLLLFYYSEVMSVLSDALDRVYGGIEGKYEKHK